MSTLTKIVSLAKKLKKEAPNKFAKWTDYVKEASKKIKPVIKKAKKTTKKVIKKAKKSIGYKKDRLAILKTTTPIIKAYRKDRKYSRKDAIKNALIDASFVSGTHTDKNSHNVKLSIYSGVNDNNLNELKNNLFLLEVYQSELNSLLKNPDQYPFNDLPKKIYNDVIKRLKNNIISKKRQISEIKKLIK